MHAAAAFEDPHYVTITEELNVPGITVWTGIYTGGLVGTYFFDGTVNAENYLELLIDLTGKLENNPELHDIKFFQHGSLPTTSSCFFK